MTTTASPSRPGKRAARGLGPGPAAVVLRERRRDRANRLGERALAGFLATITIVIAGIVVTSGLGARLRFERFALPLPEEST